MVSFRNYTADVRNYGHKAIHSEEPFRVCACVPYNANLNAPGLIWAHSDVPSPNIYLRYVRMDILRLVCSLFLVAIVLLIIAATFNNQPELKLYDKTMIILVVLLALLSVITISDLYLITLKLRTDIEAYMSECNQKVQNAYLENTEH